MSVWHAILSQIYNNRILIFAVIIILIILLSQPILVIPAVLLFIYLEGSTTEMNKRFAEIEERLNRMEKGKESRS